MFIQASRESVESSSEPDFEGFNDVELVLSTKEELECSSQSDFAGFTSGMTMCFLMEG